MQFMYRIPDLANLAARKGENKDRENSFQATRNLGRFARIEKRRPDKQRQSDAGCRIDLMHYEGPYTRFCSTRPVLGIENLKHGLRGVFLKTSSTCQAGGGFRIGSALFFDV